MAQIDETVPFFEFVDTIGKGLGRGAGHSKLRVDRE